jgi:hypothetical protein
MIDYFEQARPFTNKKDRNLFILITTMTEFMQGKRGINLQID